MSPRRLFRWTHWHLRDITACGASVFIALLALVISVLIVPRFFSPSIFIDHVGYIVTSTHWGIGSLMVFGLGAVLAVAGWRLGMDQIAFNRGFIAGGGMVIFLGVTWLAMEKVEVSNEALTVHSCWKLYHLRLPYRDLAVL